MKKLSIAAVAGILVAALLPAVAAHAEVPAEGIPIKLGHSNKCLNVQSNSLADNAKIVQYGCSPTAGNDKFKLVPRAGGGYQVQSVSSGKCLNVSNNSLLDSAPIVQYTCGTAANMLWYARDVPQRPTIRLVSVRSGKCLNLPGGSTANNVQLIQYTCSSSAIAMNEQFFLPPADSPHPVARAWTGRQPITVLHNRYEPHYLSWIGADRQANVLTVHDLNGPRTNPPAPAYQRSIGDNYVGRTQAAFRKDGRAEVIAHEAAAGDAVLTYEDAAGSGRFSAVQDFGGALAEQPTIRKMGGEGFGVATFAVRDGSLWFARESELDPQPPVGGWRELGGTNLTGAPTVVEMHFGVRIFAWTTGGRLLTTLFRYDQLTAWVDLGGPGLINEPVQVAGSGIDIAVFARTTAGDVVHKPYSVYDDDSFPADWIPLGGPAAAGPVSVHYDGKYELAYRGTDNVVHYRSETGYDTGVFGDPVRISDPADRESLAAADPTVFGVNYGTGITFPSADASVEVPVVYVVQASGAVQRMDLKAPKYPAELGG